MPARVVPSISGITTSIKTEIGTDSLDHLDRLTAIGGRTQLVALLPQNRHQHLDVGWSVVDDEDSCAHDAGVSFREIPRASIASFSRICASANA